MSSDSSGFVRNLFRGQLDANGVLRDDIPSRAWASDVKPELLDSAVTRPKRLSAR